MAATVQGSVKWFSNKKGYGFITPAEGSPNTEDIFVHQSSIFCEGYRTLGEGWEVEYEIGQDDNGKAKAINVKAPGGGPCSGPRKPRIRRGTGSAAAAAGKRRTNGSGGGGGDDGGKGGGGGGGGEGTKGKVKGRPVKPKEPFWHDELNDNVKNALEVKDIRKTTGTVDVSVGSARVKLGTNGYSSVAHARGLLAEGSFTCDEEGNVSLIWEHRLICANGLWSATDDKSTLPTAFNLADATVIPVKADETAQTLWGDLPDPKEMLEANGFQMRHVVLTPRRKR